MNVTGNWIDDDNDDEVFDDPHLIRAESFFMLGLYEEAHDELDLADRVPDLRMAVAVWKLDVYMAQKNWAEAAIYGEALCDLDPDEPRYFIAYAKVLRRLGRAEDAMAVLEDCPDEPLTMLFDYAGTAMRQWHHG